MDFRSLSNENLVFLNAEFKNKEEVLNVFVETLFAEGKIKSKEGFMKAVMDREALSATGIGEGLAIPHGKSDFVNEPTICVATLKDEIEWETLDDEPVNLVVLIAIPMAQAGDAHVEILSKLTTKLADDDFRDELVASASTKEFIEKLNVGEEVKEEVVYDDDAKTIIAITACPAGIAHTYMAAEALERAGRKLGVKVRVEKQGANGIEDEITDEEFEAAHAAIFSVSVAVKEIDRFDGIPLVETEVAEPLRRAEEIIKEALEAGKAGRGATSTKKKAPKKKMSAGEEAKKALLNGISHIVPLIVAGGTVLAVAVLISQIFGLQDVYNQDGSWLWMYRKLSGGMLSTIMIPVLAAYISFSLADKPGLGPGFAAGIAANLISSGFLGALAGGFIAGYTMKWVKKNVKGSPAFNGFFSFYLYPVIGTLVAGTLMLFVIGKPVAALNNGLTNFLAGLSGGNAMLLGAIIGAMVSFDLGGPVNKAAYAFCIGAMSNGNFIPYAIFASCKMVSAFTTTAATRLKPSLYSEEEIQCGNSTWILGFAGITEGSIPLMIEDPFRVIPSYMVGTAVTGAIVAAFGIGLQVPGAGIISALVLEPGNMSRFAQGGIWFGAALIGTVISTAILTVLRVQKAKKLAA